MPTPIYYRLLGCSTECTTQSLLVSMSAHIKWAQTTRDVLNCLLIISTNITAHCTLLTSKPQTTSETICTIYSPKTQTLELCFGLNSYNCICHLTSTQRHITTNPTCNTLWNSMFILPVINMKSDRVRVTQQPKELSSEELTTHWLRPLPTQKFLTVGLGPKHRQSTETFTIFPVGLNSCPTD